MDLSIIIVSYNTIELTLNALQSVFNSATSYQFEVFVVDNASEDGSPAAIKERYPQVRLLTNDQNLGFSKANNQAIRLTCGRYVLLLNSDTVVHQETLDVMLRYMDAHHDVGAAGCKVILPDGSLDKACKRGFPTPSASFYYAFGFSKFFPKAPRFNGYQLGYLNPDESYPVDCLVGAFMLVRRETIDQVGMLDEAFFMYGEDIDWCYRIKEAGWVVYYYPQTSIIHYKRASSRAKPVPIIYAFHEAMLLFHRKHYRQRYPFYINGLVYAGIYVKLGLALLANRLKRFGGKPS
ncbi:glycosyltransferase family 2 protein [Gorillibacterium massiliense]|uniref:glycosyltransferase family 2 protein n=1 Tax=Gorillibacterium massiliense TaxID=1280390 RepID=UPI0004AEC0CE|nr:glycosyltransferase family 2 protein [Gorillibacterium massiliense]